jgi:hypothetical protein
VGEETTVRTPRPLPLVFLFLALSNFVAALVSEGGDTGFVVLGSAFVAGAAYLWFRPES